MGPEPRSLWCPRTRSPLCLCDSLTIPRQLTSSQRATVSNPWPQFTHSPGSIAPLSGQETASPSLRRQCRRHPSPELTRCQWGRIRPRVSQTVEGETPLTVSTKQIQEAFWHPKLAKRPVWETLPYLLLHVLGVYKVLQGGASGVGGVG